MSGQLEIEKLTSLGKEIGLKGKDLVEFITEERKLLKEQRDAERTACNEEREAERIARDEEREAEHIARNEERKHELELQEMKVRLEQEKGKQEQDSMQAHGQFKIQEAQAKVLEEEKSLEKEEKLLERQITLEEMRLKTAELNQSGGANASVQQSRPFSKAPRLPSFDESKDNVDAYLLRFERYATQQGWPKEQWAVYLSTLLSGKGLEVYYALNDEQANEYDTLKNCILNRYELNEEGFRKKFKYSKPETGESGPQYATRIANYFQRWVELATKNIDIQGLIDVLIRDQFIHSLPTDTATFIRERKM